MKKGFTILEVIVAIFVITIGVLGAFSVVQRIVSNTMAVSSRLTAVYLAKEGIEIVRNNRDNNWLDPAEPPWDSGLSSTGWITHTELPKYERRTTITLVGSDMLKVLVDVRWTEKGQTHTVNVQENLYDWKQ